MKKPDELIENLIEDSIKLEDATHLGKSSLMNKQYEYIKKTENELRNYGEDAVQRVIKLLNHENNYVKYNAAFFIAPIYLDEARRVFTEISQLRGSIGFNEMMTLREWDNGNLKFNN